MMQGDDILREVSQGVVGIRAMRTGSSFDAGDEYPHVWYITTKGDTFLVIWEHSVDAVWPVVPVIVTSESQVIRRTGDTCGLLDDLTEDEYTGFMSAIDLADQLYKGGMEDASSEATSRREDCD